MSNSRTKNSKRTNRNDRRNVSTWWMLVAVALIAVVGIICYGHVIDAPFYFDDDTSIVSNDAIQKEGLGAVVEAVWESDKRRLVPYLTLAANYALGGLQEGGYRLVNIGIHIAAGCTVFWLVWMLLGSPAMKDNPLTAPAPGRNPSQTKFLFAVFAGLLFVAHPLQTQAVTYIVQRMASLAGLFSLLAMALYAVFAAQRSAGAITPKGWISYGGALLAVLLAMFTKENTVVLPLAVLLMDIAFFSLPAGQIRRAVVHAVPLLLTLPVLPLMVLFLSPGDGVEATVGAEIGSKIPALHYLLTQFNVIVTYIRLLFVPTGQNLDYHYPVSTSLFAGTTLPALLFLLALVALAVVLWKKHRPASFGILFFFLALSVESSLISLPDVIFEHRLYLPMFGFVLALGYGLFYLTATSGRRLLPASALPFVLAVVVLAACTATYQRNEVWSSVETLWGDVITKSPGKARPYVNIGDYFYKQGKYDKALPYFRKAVQLDSTSAAACNNLGCVLWYRGELDEAEKYVRRAISTKKRFYQAYNILGSIYFNRGNLDSAETLFRRSLEHRPDFVDARANLGAVYMQRQQFDSAAAELLKVVERMPHHPQANHNLALVYMNKQQYAVATKYAERAHRLGAPLSPALAARLRELWQGYTPALR